MHHLQHARRQPRGHGAQAEHLSFTQIGEIEEGKLHPQEIVSH